jgi:hypothetical protein
MFSGSCYTVCLLVAMFGQIEETPDPNLKRETAGRLTLGGTQFWTDHLVCQSWRIQQNVKFGQFRLLNPSNRVAHTGTYEECRRAFDAVSRQPTFPAIPSTVLVSVHGLGRTRNSMSAIGEYVSDAAEIGWINVGYASTRTEILAQAQALRHVLDELTSLKLNQDAKADSNLNQPGIQFHFIAHSLGNIVIRTMLGEVERNDDGPRPAWRVGRIVMLGPPNQGSAMANLLKRSNMFRLIAGSSGKELGAEWEDLQERLATPKCEFAIIAGGKSDGKGYNPLLEGDDDLIVRVEETQLAGATDFAVIPSIHTYLMDRREAKEMTLSFLQTGLLKSVADTEGEDS